MLVKPTLYCDIDSTINDHWKRIKRNTSEGICNWSRAFSEEEVMKDKQPFESQRQDAIKQIAALRIVVDPRFQAVVNTFLRQLES